MTMRDTPGGPVGPEDRGADAAGCAWWWWVVAIIVIILILWWIFAWTRPAYRYQEVPPQVPPTQVPAEEGVILPLEPAEEGRGVGLMVSGSAGGFYPRSRPQAVQASFDHLSTMWAPTSRAW